MSDMVSGYRFLEALFWKPFRDKLTLSEFPQQSSQTRATRSSIQVSRKAREKLSKTGFMMYSKNVRSPVLM
jgi:hypothetical protein